VSNPLQFLSNYGFVALAKEAIAGTAVPSTDYFELVSETLMRDPGTKPVAAMRGTRASNVTYIQGEGKLDGNIVVPFGPSIGLRALAAALGIDHVAGSTPSNATTPTANSAVGANSVALTAVTGFTVGGFIQLTSATTPAQTEVHKILSIAALVVTFATGETLASAFATADAAAVVVAPFTHTMTPKETGLPTLTIEKNLGGLTSLQWAGCMVSKAELKLSTTKEAEATYSIMGQKEAQVTPTTAAYTSETPYALANMSVSKAGAADVTPKSATLTIDNKGTGEYTFGGVNTPTMIYTGQRLITGTLAYLLQNMTDYNDALAATPRDLAFTLSQSASDSCKFDLPNVVWGKPSIPLKLGDLIRVTMPFTAYYLAGATTDITVTAVNGVWLGYC